jgi:hypothetical protein
MPTTAARLWRHLVALTLLSVVIGAGNALGADQSIEPRLPPPNPMNVAADALILRPVGLVMIPVAGLVYALGYPFARAAGNQQEVYQSLLGDTIDFTFHRPLGRGEPFD